MLLLADACAALLPCLNPLLFCLQVETGSAITWKYPSCILKGDNSHWRVFQCGPHQQHAAGRHWDQDGAHWEEHTQPHCEQGHFGGALEECLQVRIDLRRLVQLQAVAVQRLLPECASSILFCHFMQGPGADSAVSSRSSQPLTVRQHADRRTRRRPTPTLTSRSAWLELSLQLPRLHRAIAVPVSEPPGWS